MSSISRKYFLQQLGMAGIVAVAPGNRFFSKSFYDTPVHPKPPDAIGLQLYSIIPLLRKDFEGTLKTVAEIGYKEVEFAGPYYFNAENEGLESGYYGNNAKQMRALLDTFGLAGPAAHVGLNTLQTNLPGVIEAANTVEHKYLVCPYLAADQRSSLDDYKKLADEFNAIGEECKKSGIQFAYHNHCFEFGKMDGKIPYNVLLDSTDPELVKMELDLFWISIAGYDPVDYFKNYPGRFPAVHIKDMKKDTVLEDPLNTFENRDSIMKAIGNLEDPGKGVIDFKRILSHHKQAGIRHYFIERDRPPKPMETIKNGYTYLSKLNI